MAQTYSTMLELGTEAPGFALPGPGGTVHRLADFDDAPALLVIFMCNHCPYVIHLKDKLAEVARLYQKRGVAIVGINANDAETHPDDAPAKMVDDIKAHGYAFPYLVDATQCVAKAYQAACTPDFFLFDAERKLIYRGQFDETRPGGSGPTGADLCTALDAVLAGTDVPADQIPSMGCNIKWKPGNEPDYT